MGYFYVKSGLGTRTSGGSKTQESGAFGSAGLEAADVYVDIGTALADASPPVAGDFICCSDVHAAAFGAHELITVPSGVIIISVDDTSADTYKAGADEHNTSGNYQVGGVAGGNVRIEGVTLEAEDNMRFTVSGAVYNLKDCQLGAAIYGTASSSYYTEASVDGVTINIRESVLRASEHASSSIVRIRLGVLINVYGGSIYNNTTGPGFLCALDGNGGGTLNCYGVDLTNLASGASIMDATAAASEDVNLINLYDCKMPASWALGEEPTSAGSIITLENCDDGNDRSVRARRDIFGQFLTDGSVYDNAADTVEGQDFSLNVLTSAKAASQAPFRFSLGKVRADFSSAKDIVVQLAHDSLGAGTGSRFENDEAWIEAHIPNSGDPGFSIETTGLANSLAAAVGTYNTASSATWTKGGKTLGVAEEITLTTAGTGGEGWAEVFICFGKASIGADDLFVSHDVGVS